MTEFLIYIGLWAVIAVLAIVIILLLSNLSAYFTKIALGTTVFINAGEDMRKILPNIGGYGMSRDEDLDGRHWLVPTKGESEKEREKDRMKRFFHESLPGTVWFQKWLWEHFGVRFISWFWPHVHVHRFDIRKGGRRRVEARADVGADAPLRSRVVDSGESTIVSSLLALVPRPVYLEGIELAGDNSRINLLLLPVYRQVIPALPVYYLKADFFSLLDAAIEAAIVDFFSQYRGKDGKGTPLTYAEWLKLSKAGEESPIEVYLRHLNVSHEYIVALKKKDESEEKKSSELIDYIEKYLIPKGDNPAEQSASLAGLIPSGIVVRFGFALVSFRIVEWEPHSSTVDLARAILAKEIQSHTADGVREESYGVRDATLARATGESKRYQQLVSALVKKGVTPDIAAMVVQTQLRTENIRDSKITTYVEGGSSASVLVSASSPSLTK